MSNVVVAAVTIAAMLLQVTATDSRQDVDNEIKVRTELIILSILNKLGMQKPPKFNGQPTVQDRIRKYKYDHDQKPGTRGAPVLPEQEQQARQIQYLGMHHVQEDHQPRARRNAMSGMECNQTLQCCQFPLTVDFEEYGWDWIIVPRRFEANYCSGTCELMLSSKYPHTCPENMTKSDTGSSCAPRNMSAISVLYYDHDYKNIKYALLPRMVVDSCGCC